jgi:hypothetical protein
MQALTASWGAWMEAFERCYKELPDTAADVGCPNCGAPGLRMTFCGLPEDRVGYASFWCDACLTGVHLSRCAVPDGVPMESIATPVEARAVRVPNYTLLWPDESE